MPIVPRRSTERRLPRWSELAPLLQRARRTGSPDDRRVLRAATIADLRMIARGRTPRAVFDYVDGAAEAEISMRRSREAFDRVEFHPRVLRDVSRVDTATTILGRPAQLPLIFAPTGFTRMMHHDGELAVGRVAADTGIPYALSTMATTSVEDLADALPDANRWFQLYMWRDRGRSRELVDRAYHADYTTLVVTADVPVAGARLRDGRNGMTIPPTLSVRTLLDGARYPSWWLNFLTTEPLSFACFSGQADSLTDLVNTMFDPSVTFADIEWLRGIWSRSIVVKGIQSVQDAETAVSLGVDGIVLSNHGGRQLDRAVTPLELLPSVAEKLGSSTEILLDSGVRSGADIAAAVALGARAVLVGRAYLYGLMAGGESGVRRAVDLLRSDLIRTMQLLGVSQLDDLDPSTTTLR